MSQLQGAMSEKFTPEELYAGEAYCDNGALSHWDFVNGEGERIGIFVDEDATTLERMKRQEAYAHLFAAASEMYECVCDALSDLKMPEGMRDHFEKVLKKARGEG